MSTARRNTIFALSLCTAVLAACGSTRNNGRPTGNNPAGCPMTCKQCDGDGKCLDCPTAGGNICSGNTVVTCNADGTVGATVKTCDPGYACAAADCISACDVAAASHSYIGCDYWPTTTLTSQLNPYFDFAVAVANPLKAGDVTQGLAAEVTITRNGKNIATKSIAPGAVETIVLPWVQALSQQPSCVAGGDCTPQAETSALVTGGAYHLVSSIPVTVYQFSPLQFEKPMSNTCVDGPYKACTKNADCHPGDSCAFDPVYGQKVCANKTNCHSYTNDASILLPSTALKTDYIVISRQTFADGDALGGGSHALPGYTAIVATDDGTDVTVTSSAFTEAGTNVKALSPGGTQNFMLNKGDVLQLVSKRVTSPCAGTSKDANYNYCDLGPKYDLTGTTVTSSKPVAVFGGHSCSFIPYNKWACDHLEEQITPTDTWGQKILVAQTRPATKNEPNVFRVVSGTDGNMITFDPPSVHAPLSLDKAGYVEFIATGAFGVSSTGRIAVGQYMVGENYFDAAMIDVGDPALGLGVPVEQYRSDYDFLSPSTYTQNDLTLIAPMNATIKLDDADVSGTWTPIGSSGFGYLYVALKPGAHHVSGSSAFGITVSGIANYTSYMFVGGQNLNDVPLQ